MLRLLGAVVLSAVAVVAILFGPRAIEAISGGGFQAFPDPVENVAVYDPAGALTPDVEALLEDQIDALEARSGAEVAIYVRIDPGATDESNLADARALIDQWGVGRRGFDDGFVILVSFFDDTFEHGVLSTYAGGGFKANYLNEAAQAALRDNVIIPGIQQGSVGGGLVAAMTVIDDAVTPAATARLEAYRVINAIVGIPGAILALFVTLGSAYYAWSRYGNDPEVADSESVLMAGPPAGMTPSLATVVRSGRATQHSINTLLIDLAGRGLLVFRNLDRVGKVKRDDDPDPLVDPAIDVVPWEEAHSKRLPPAEREAYGVMQELAVGGTLTREPLWRMNDKMGDVKSRLEDETVRLGWLTQRPTPVITRWMIIGGAEVLAAIGLAWLGYAIPMSGLTLVGAALAVGGIGTVAFGSAMSQRTPQGAYVDAMLKAYRRTLQKTMDLARNMAEVVARPEVATLADTPDKAVVWGIALGLRKEVAGVLERGLADARTPERATTAYYPVWLGSSGSSNAGPAAAGAGLAGAFSAGGTPDIGGMFSALGSVGSSPASSSSGGGGFGGGGGGGGGGGSSGF
jgi:uncharacterized membrane protein YgcG